MIEHVISRIGGVGVYGVISICLFFAVFIGVLAWTLCLKQPYLNTMRELPLEDSSAPEPDADLTANPGKPHD
jgi:hypothetical protein